MARQRRRWVAGGWRREGRQGLCGNVREGAGEERTDERGQCGNGAAQGGEHGVQRGGATFVTVWSMRGGDAADG